MSVKDPVCGMTIEDEQKAAGSSTYEGKTYYFCSADCKATFDQQPEKYAEAADVHSHESH